MKRIQIELRLENKILYVNANSLRLDDSLFSAGVNRVQNEENENALELRYRSKVKEFAEREAEIIYLFLKQKGLIKRLNTYNYPDEILPTIAIVGQFDAGIHLR
ncbi:MAG: hypothetical protein Q8L29_01920 [archaeon]|nr:hypothetical protein [archaeon]